MYDFNKTLLAFKDEQDFLMKHCFTHAHDFMQKLVAYSQNQQILLKLRLVMKFAEIKEQQLNNKQQWC